MASEFAWFKVYGNREPDVFVVVFYTINIS